MSKIDDSVLGQIRKAKDETDAAAKLARTNEARLKLASALAEKNVFVRQQKMDKLLQEYGEVDYG